MRRALFQTTFALATIGSASAAQAQLTIQQPVFGVNSTATTVSVPDRGRAHLSSISRAGDSRTVTGPFRSGSNFGQFRDHSSTSVTATIHDFEEMDRYLLNQPTTAAAAGSIDRDADYRALLARNQRRGMPLGGPSIMSVAGAGAVTEPAPPAAARALPPLPKVNVDSAQSFALGQKAEERGAVGVARLHYRMAAKSGHAEAAARLEALGSPTTARLGLASERR